VRAHRPVRAPVVLTAEEARQVILSMARTPRLVVKLLLRQGGVGMNSLLDLL
jgi:hypothetical protein